MAKSTKTLEWFDTTIDRLQKERAQLESKLRKQYRSGRTYVRKNPTRSVGVVFAAGIILGLAAGLLISEED